MKSWSKGEMKATQNVVVVAVAVVLLGGVTGWMINKHQISHVAATQAARVAEFDSARASSEAQPVAPSVAPATAGVAVPQSEVAPPENPPPSKPDRAIGRTNSTPQKRVVQANQGGPPPKEPLRDPLARVALAFVGDDEWAEAYWYEAINDPRLSAHERSDLIEDLNEEGFADPKHPTADDLPLIVNRILMIEEVGWDAMDEVNADAFAEAYKDLVNLADLVMGGGELVR